MNIGIAFDMDGVIVDNYKYHYESWVQLAKKYSISFSYEDYRDRMNGRTLKELAHYLFNGSLTDDQIVDLGIEKESLYRELYSPDLQPANGLIKFLNDCKANNIGMVIGTSAPAINVDFTLDGLNIRDYFKTIVDDKSVTKGKPDPEVYQKCAEALKLPNSRCIVFEDAHSGILAGKAAGSKVIALATSHSRSELDADLIIDDFTQIRVEDLKNLLDT